MTIEPVALVTGSSRGIGRELALQCARLGFAVVVNGRSDRAAGEAVAAEIVAAGGRAHPILADVSDEAQARALVDGAVAAFGGLGVVINNAGIAPKRTLAELDAATFQATLDANLLSAFHVSQAAVPHLTAKGGRLIFISSGAARTGGRVSAAYAASKAGMEGLMRYYATYLREHGVTSNAVAPTLVQTDMVSNLGALRAADLPMGRLGRVEEMWPAVRMIIETEYMTGQTVHLNAGRFMT